jgi:hypothetical protein
MTEIQIVVVQKEDRGRNENASARILPPQILQRAHASARAESAVLRSLIISLCSENR